MLALKTVLAAQDEIPLGAGLTKRDVNVGGKRRMPSGKDEQIAASDRCSASRICRKCAARRCALRRQWAGEGRADDFRDHVAR